MRAHEPENHESSSVHGLRSTGSSSTQRRSEAGSEGQRSAGSDPRHDGQRGRLRAAEIRLRPLDLGAHAAGVRHPKTATTRSRAGARRGRRCSRREGQVVPERRPGLRGDGHRAGSPAEYICLRESPQTGAIATMPATVGYEEAAAVPYGGGEALQFLRKANVRSGQRVLVNGAGGSFGTFAVQLAKVLGAHVTAVDSAPKLEMLRAIGADRVIDYSQEDFTDSPQTYDVIFDVVRNTPSGRMVRLLTENGCLLMANPGFSQIVRARWASRGSKKRVVLGASSGTSEDLAYLRGLVEAGRLHPVIDRRFPLERMVEAHRYAETGQKLGNVVVVVA